MLLSEAVGQMVGGACAIRRRLRSKEASTEELAQVQKHFSSLVVSAVTQHFQHMARLEGEAEPDI